MASHSILNSTFPVFLPHFVELHLSDAEFVRELDKLNRALQQGQRKQDDSIEPDTTSEESQKKPEDESTQESPFIQALHASNYRYYDSDTLAADNKAFTDNGDIRYISSQDALVDLFYKLDDNVSDADMLEKAWKVDSLATLKIIFNARSIHLGKSNRVAAYRAFGWLYKEHPMTFLASLPWLVHPVIPKPSPKKQSDEKAGDKEAMDQDEKEDAVVEEDDFVVINPPKAATYDTNALDRKNGLAHGYWKDLLNILVLAAEDYLGCDRDPKIILNVDSGYIQRKQRRKPRRAPTQTRTVSWDPDEAKRLRHTKRNEQQQKIVEKLDEQPTYRFLHIAVARLFAGQLKRDLALLNSPDEKAKNQISLAAKWAPSLKEFHDKHTFIATSIAEILLTHEEVCPAETPKSDRETYLKHARAALQSRVLSPLRKALDIVERHITARTFTDIRYEKVPSLAMARYNKLFISKDETHFEHYLTQVESGESRMTGAVLLPANLVSRASTLMHDRSKQAMAETRVLDSQWNTLVQRIKDSGKIESSIAVCDVSGSMLSPRLQDKTTPMDSAIGLSLLLAEICDPPFGGTFITFDNSPQVMKVGGSESKSTFSEKVQTMQRSPWGGSTNFVAVFEDLILPLAVKHKLKQEDMVKQVFVFSDMQFNQSQAYGSRWSTSFERIQKAYKSAGYEMPTLIFWNLASGAKGVPVTSSEPGTALVSGYSQGQMKVFLDGGGFGEPDEEDDEVMIDAEGNEVKTEKQKKTDPVSIMRKAVSHEAYAMLTVVD